MSQNDKTHYGWKNLPLHKGDVIEFRFFKPGEKDPTEGTGIISHVYADGQSFKVKVNGHVERVPRLACRTVLTRGEREAMRERALAQAWEDVCDSLEAWVDSISKAVVQVHDEVRDAIEKSTLDDHLHWRTGSIFSAYLRVRIMKEYGIGEIISQAVQGDMGPDEFVECMNGIGEIITRDALRFRTAASSNLIGNIQDQIKQEELCEAVSDIGCQRWAPFQCASYWPKRRETIQTEW